MLLGKISIFQTHRQIFFTSKVSEITCKHQHFSHVLKWKGQGNFLERTSNWSLLWVFRIFDETNGAGISKSGVPPLILPFCPVPKCPNTF